MLEPTLDAIRPFLEMIGAVVVAGGGLSFIVYAIFKHLAAKWLDGQFEARLQALKHQHNKELEELRFKIAALLDRATKLHGREFETLPEAWSKLIDAFFITSKIVSMLQYYPDIDHMTPAQQTEFIDACRLNAWEKEELSRIDRKTQYYQKQIVWHDLYEAKSKVQEAHIFLLKNGIFFSEEIRQAFQELDSLVLSAISEHEINVQYEVRPMQLEKIGALTQRGHSLLQEIEVKVRDRLWPNDNVGL